MILILLAASIASSAPCRDVGADICCEREAMRDLRDNYIQIESELELCRLENSLIPQRPWWPPLLLAGGGAAIGMAPFLPIKPALGVGVAGGILVAIGIFLSQ